jgi:hypothetical protein|tara:strand:- start:373 stop:474 length:102 start_codon:yes stop_codon:yes gene_type:complete
MKRFIWFVIGFVAAMGFGSWQKKRRLSSARGKS